MYVIASDPLGIELNRTTGDHRETGGIATQLAGSCKLCEEVWSVEHLPAISLPVRAGLVVTSLLLQLQGTEFVSQEGKEVCLYFNLSGRYCLIFVYMIASDPLGIGLNRATATGRRGG